MIRLQVVGGGRMGEALLSGLLAAGWAAPAEFGVVEPDPDRAAELRRLHEGVVVADTPQPCLGAVLAVKPDQATAAARAVAAAGTERLLSIAAGVRLDTLEATQHPGTPVIRAMPNTPALIGQGAAAIAPGTHAGDDDVDWAAEILGSVGIVVRLDEVDLDAVTGLSGSGPAYVFAVVEALTDAGVAAGLTRDTAAVLTAQTVLGAARLLEETGRSPAELRAQVTSPGGTTAAGLAILAAADLDRILVDVVAAATARSRELAAGG